MKTVMPVEIQHLHTYFLFAFSIDREAMVLDYPEFWRKYPNWFEALDAWITTAPAKGKSGVADGLGQWRRAPYRRFDMDSPAYHDMVFFHPFVRRVFFDSAELAADGGEHESLLHCYTIPIQESEKVFYEAEDVKGRRASVEVTDLRLMMFANGVGILSIGVEAFHRTAEEVLWINEQMRKVYPSSGRQLREARFPNRLRFTLERNGAREVLTEERFEKGEMIGFQPPLASTIKSLLYFANYQDQEFEPVLDERMIAYTYLNIDPRTVPEGFLQSEEYQILLSRILYVDLAGPDYRYQPEFVKSEMDTKLYRRWAHQGTYYGFTSYSSIATTVGSFDCDEHDLREGFLIHRMFRTRYYLMAVVTLFYRVTLLGFSERTALVSKRLYRDQESGKLSNENIGLANDLRADFLHFSNYWHFDELANKDEELEHFRLQCLQYRTEAMKQEIADEIDKLNASLHNYYQYRNTEAVNRLAMLSLIFGAGAVLTGFFGMNFGRAFGKLFFEPAHPTPWVHYVSVGVVTLLAFGAIGFGFYVVLSNWSDYRDTLITQLDKSQRQIGSLRRDEGPKS